MGSSLSEAEARKLSEAASRLAKAYAPVAVQVVQFAASQDPPVENSAEELFQLEINRLVSFFATADGRIGQREAELLDTFSPTDFAGLVSAVGDLQAGDMYEFADHLGGLAETSIPAAARVLMSAMGESAGREYESAVLDLGRFICEVDGTDPSESEALASVKRWIDEALGAS